MSSPAPVAPPAAPPIAAPIAAPLAARRPIEWLRWACFGGSGVAALFFVGLLALFVVQSLPVWRAEGVAGYLFGSRWFYRAGELGALPMIYGTLAVSAIALLLAAPIGVGAAIFTAELLPGRARLAAKTAIELLAGVPSVVYGLLGVLLLRGWMQRLLAPFEPLSGDTLATGGVLLAVMVLPTITTLADDALRGVAGSQRRAARALGLSRAGAVVRAVLPAALPGIAAALLLALGRALGETIAVFLVIGRQDNQLPAGLTDLRPLIEPGQTLTTKLGGAEAFIAYGDPVHWAAIVGLGLVLLALVLAVTLTAALLGRRRGSGAARG